MDCFYYSKLEKNIAEFTLYGQEARHVVAVRRIKVSEQLYLFDGQGQLATVELLSVSKNSAKVRLIRMKQLDSKKRRLILASAIPKGDRLSVMLNMATQLGMTDFIPLLLERSVVRCFDEKKTHKYQRNLIEACKQSQQFFIPKIHPLSELKQIQNWLDKDTLLVLADPAGFILPELINKKIAHKKIIFLIGPEGGFSPAEESILKNYDLLRIKLADSILRTETAGVAILSALNHVEFI